MSKLSAGAVQKQMITIKFLPLLLILALHCIEFTFVFVSGEVITCIEHEREALLVFKRGLIDDYGVLSSWEGQHRTRECCNWAGVRCSNVTGHVIGLQLYGDDDLRQLGGEISPALLKLRHLNSLDLSNNNFKGHQVPEFIGSMKTLRHLNLAKSNFSGTIPRGLGNLTNLRTLDLSYNSFTFENLDWLSHLSLLSRLSLSGSDISDAGWMQHVLKLGALQELFLQLCQIAQVTSSADVFVNSSNRLSKLNLSQSNLTSSIFSWLINASTSFVSIDLSHNHLDGPVPDALGNLNFLEYLDLSDNNLEHGIPKSFGNLSHLQMLYLTRNKLDEPLAEIFGNLCCKAIALLEALDLSLNQITGSVPDLSPFLALRQLNLQYNRLSGLLPISLGELSSLEMLDVSYNSLQGTVSEAHLMKLNNLKLLGLSFNALAMNISPNWTPPFQLDAIHLACCTMGPQLPAWIRTQNLFSSLDLSCTGISQELPEWFWDLSPRLNYLNLSINNISGEIPDLSSKFVGSSLIDISSNIFSGPLPTFHPNSTMIQISCNMFNGPISSICLLLPAMLLLLDLSHNQLSGELPDCWDNMSGLFALNLAYNKFSGAIPPSFASLSQLQTLILRRNAFSGELPSAFGKWQELKIIDIGENQLTGSFPAWIGTYCLGMTFLIIQQNMFFGSIPSQLCYLSNIQILDLSRNNFSGKIPACFDNFTTIADNNRINQTMVSIFSYARTYDMVDLYTASVQVQWKGKVLEYNKTLGLLKLIDLSCNGLTGGIPRELYTLKGLISLNLSRNNLTGIIDPNIGNMQMLESLDLSRNQLSGAIPIGLARLHYLQVLDLADNKLSGRIPTGTQLQSFDASVFDWNGGLCGDPLALCPTRSMNNYEDNGDDDETRSGFITRLSLLQGLGICMGSGFIFSLGLFVGSLLLKESWRIAYFNFLDCVWNWLYAKTSLFLAKFD